MSSARKTTTEELAGQLVVSLDPSPATRDLVARRVVEFAQELADDAALGEVVAALDDESTPIGSADLALRAGVTYRQVTYWTAEGYLDSDRVEGAGSGRSHVYGRDAVVKARIMGALVRLFAIPPARAAELADQIMVDGRVELGSFVLTREGLSS
jgi:hypothetical protein